VVLGIYVLATLLREKATFVPRSRASILIGSARWVIWRTKKILGSQSEAEPQPRSGPYSSASVFSIGIIHGLGAETPSQLLLFLLAANLGGVTLGLLGLSVFLAGLLVMNTLMTASAVGIFGLSAAKPSVLRFVIAATAAYSVVVGGVFLFGASSFLPQLGG
jgi:high-affinity nickel-transport protein